MPYPSVITKERVHIKDSQHRLGWRDVKEVMTRPQPVTIPMVTLFLIIPVYLFIGNGSMLGQPLHVPELAWDRAVVVQPAWSLVYGSLFLAALLPVFVVHQQELVRRTILAFLLIWLTAYAVFIVYPTLTPRPAKLTGDDFFTWTLRAIYASDGRYNCFPSLHVAQCFLAASICYCVNRGVGAAAFVWASLVGVSTVLIKQHYIADVIGGMLLAGVAWLLLLRDYPRADVPERERRLAPAFALFAVGLYVLVIVGFLVGYQLDTP